MEYVKNCPEKLVEFTEKCVNWEVVLEILYLYVWFLKENFMMVIRELEMAWKKIRKMELGFCPEKKLGLGFFPEIELGKKSVDNSLLKKTSVCVQ